MKKRVILVGGGHAHTLALATYVTKPPGDAEIILITLSRFQTYSGMLPGWIYGNYAAEDCRIDLTGLAQRAGVQISKEDADADIAKREQNRRNEEDTAKQARAITEVKANEEAEARNKEFPWT
jgi:NADH dehydrogenase FAD-containing subunit